MNGTDANFSAGKVFAAAKATLAAIDAERQESTNRCLERASKGRRFNWRRLRFEEFTRTPAEAVAYAKRYCSEWLSSAKTKFWRQYEFCEQLVVFAAALNPQFTIRMTLEDFHFIAAHYPNNPHYGPAPAEKGDSK